ncbi:helix-turn-helix domain-containing protein [Chryseobacterium sp. LC2016-27]|jgi:transcriptional regulator with XRE-family HTH domain|uniref:helix-turn-helix domain-containing protein n=1 Tax=Chryseobacterium sp. LC2016-27 TaxID=2897326 RepID=UPI001E3ED192|nr:helix-turn-helix domain-containing protein [Chryseobacterium sp. LC2016-27]MCD0454148.1 helix-turn-helix domain-containing protein [Chryseobacterium sp. LC2016-27]
MVQEKLKTLRKQRGLSQEKMSKILSTDPSNYSRKERGEIGIHEEEWQKLADALNVPLEEIKEEKLSGSVHNDNSTFNDNSGNYYSQYFNIPNSIVENLQDYISLLKKEVEHLKKENKNLKSQSK